MVYKYYFFDHDYPPYGNNGSMSPPRDLGNQVFLGLNNKSTRKNVSGKTGRPTRHKASIQNYLAILGTCRLTRVEAEDLFFSLATFDLIGPCREDGYVGFRNLRRLSRRQLSRILIINTWCYPSIAYAGSTESLRNPLSVDTHFEWSLSLEFLPYHCTSLKRWRVCAKANGCESEFTHSITRKSWISGMATCLDSLRQLETFEARSICDQERHPLPSYPQHGPLMCIPTLQQKHLQVRQYWSSLEHPRVLSTIFHEDQAGRTFPFLNLPQNLRQRIYQLALLTPSKLINPCAGTWIRRKTRNIVPLLQTCQQIRDEAESVFYTEAIFTVIPSAPRFHAEDVARLCKFFDDLPARLRGRIRRVGIPRCGNWAISEAMATYIHIKLNVDQVYYILSYLNTVQLNRDWFRRAENMGSRKWRLILGSFENLRVLILGRIVIPPGLRAWMEQGVREQRRDVVARRLSLRGGRNHSPQNGDFRF